MANPPQKIYGLTGNIGCGKSAVAKILAEFPGVKVIDSDKIAKEIASANADELDLRLGTNLFSSGDSKGVAKLIFNNPEKKKTLESYLYPLVYQKIEEGIRMSQGRAKIIVVESALIFETKSDGRYDAVIAVTCKEEEQLRRLRENRNLTENEIEERLRNQLPQAIKASRAQFVIDTDCRLEELPNRIRQFYEQSLAKSPRKERVAIYAGSFDPPTKGHEWVIREASKTFDHVIVAIGVNPEKKPMFSLSERIKMLIEATRGIENASIDAYEKEYLVNFADRKGAQSIIRGIRNTEDFEYERLLRNVNGDLNPTIQTIYLIPPRELADVSSGLVRGLIGYKGWEKAIDKFVSEDVSDRIKEKLQ